MSGKGDQNDTYGDSLNPAVPEPAASFRDKSNALVCCVRISDHKACTLNIQLAFTLVKTHIHRGARRRILEKFKKS